MCRAQAPVLPVTAERHNGIVRSTKVRALPNLQLHHQGPIQPVEASSDRLGPPMVYRGALGAICNGGQRPVSRSRKCLGLYRWDCASYVQTDCCPAPDLKWTQACPCAEVSIGRCAQRPHRQPLWASQGPTPRRLSAEGIWPATSA